MATVKQKKAIRNIAKQVNKGERVNAKKAMLEAGYSKHVAKQSGGKLLDTAGGREELDKVFGKTYIKNLHEENLQAYKFDKISFGQLSQEKARIQAKNMGLYVVNVHREDKQTIVVVKTPDWVARDRAVDKVYKLNGSYEADKENSRNKYAGLTDAEIEAKLEEVKKKLQK